MRRHYGRLALHANGKPCTKFLADRRVMEAADLDLTLLCDISHGESSTLCSRRVTIGTIGGRSQDVLPGFSLWSPRFANKMRRNPARPVLSSSRRRLSPQAGRPWPAPRHHSFALWE